MIEVSHSHRQFDVMLFVNDKGVDFIVVNNS